MTEWNLADLWERLADAAGDAEAVVAGSTRLTYRDLDDRATRLANAMASRGVGTGDRVGIYSKNRAEFIEAMLAVYKLRAAPLTINYRYVEPELRYILADSEPAALIYEQQYAPLVGAVAADFSSITALIELDGDESPALSGAVGYETAIDAASPARKFPPRSADDLYLLYTGGTTGMPKGTMWRHEDIFFGAMGGGQWGGRLLEAPDDIANFAAGIASGQRITFGVIAPLMHGAAQWLSFGALLSGGRVAIYDGAHFDANDVLEFVAAESVNSLAVVGDAMARPLAAAMQTSTADLSSLMSVGSGGAILSEVVKDELRSRLPNLMIVDTYGSSELGAGGGPAASAGSGSRFAVSPEVAVLDEVTYQPVVPGSGTVGKIARRGHIPIGYWRDEAKTAATFPVVDGVRWSVPGDFATVEADGTVALLGRGSQCINTGGEKVFPEEVEAALKAHPAVYDAAVVGAPDERFGERVVAVVSPRDGSMPELDDVVAHCRTMVAAYKVPRDLIVVDEVRRNAVGKLDLAWARSIANV